MEEEGRRQRWLVEGQRRRRDDEWSEKRSTRNEWRERLFGGGAGCEWMTDEQSEGQQWDGLDG